MFNTEMVRIIETSGDSQKASVSEKLLDLYLNESLTGPLNMTDKKTRQGKIMRILKALYPISFREHPGDPLGDPKFLEYLRKSKNISSDVKQDLSDISTLMKVAKVPKIYKELEVGEKEYLKRLYHIRLRKDLLKGFREFEKTNRKNMSKEEKAEIKRLFHEFELRNLDPLIYIAEVLDPKDIGFDALHLFLDLGASYTNPLDRKRAVVEYKKALLRDYLVHLDKSPMKPYVLNIKAFEAKLIEEDIKND